MRKQGFNILKAMIQCITSTPLVWCGFREIFIGFPKTFTVQCSFCENPHRVHHWEHCFHWFLLPVIACSGMQSHRRNRFNQFFFYLLPPITLPDKSKAACAASIFYFSYHICCFLQLMPTMALTPARIKGINFSLAFLPCLISIF